MRGVTLLLLGMLVAGCRTTPLPLDGGSGGEGGSGGSGGGGGSVDMAGGTHPCTLLCTFGLTCCDNQCVNLRNDVHNCGGCGIVCSGPQPFCDGTKCAPAPCSPACTGGQLCCEVNGPGPARPPMCTAPTDAGTCPLGCPLCQ
jgi:hypothetical protein